MKQRLLSFIFSCLACLGVQSQLPCTFTHYSSENGLSENTVMDMVQDHEGQIWIATWDGVNRFDGYNFKVYKARQNNSVEWNSNRIDHLAIDKYGNVWCITYDCHAFRFDRRMEAFEEVPAEGEGRMLPIVSIVTLDNGTVWLLTEDNGGIRVTFDAVSGRTTSKVYLSAATSGRGTKINSVYLDSKHHEWLLTSNGLVRVDAETGQSTNYFVNSTSNEVTNQPFFSVLEQGGHLFFGSVKGRIWDFFLQREMFELTELALDDAIMAIEAIDSSRVAVVTPTHGLAIGNLQKKEMTYDAFGHAFDFRKYPVHSVYTDKEKEVWMGVSKQGVVCHFNPATHEFKVEQLSVEIEPTARSNPNFAICEDILGNLWVHPMGGGLSWFDREANRLVPFYDEIGSSQWRFSNKMHSMMSDRQGNLWLGTHSKGLEKVTFFRNQFRLMKPLECNYDTNINQVRSICEDRQQRLWVGTRDGKVQVYTPDWQLIGFLTTDGRIAKSGTPYISAAYKIMQDSRGDMWIATKGYGVIHLKGEGTSYRMEHFVYSQDDMYSLSSNNVYDVAEDGKGRLWMITFDGGINYLEKNAKGEWQFINSRNNMKSYPMNRCSKARRMVRDAKGYLWVATSNGLLAFSENFAKVEDIRFYLYERVTGDKGGLGGNNVYDMLQTKSGDLFFALFDGGLSLLKSFDKEGNAVFQSYTVRDGLPTDVLFSLAEDKEGNLWIGTENGLSRMGHNSRHFDNYLRRELGEDVIFEESTAMLASDQRLLFGSNRGILAFYPHEIHKNSYVPDIVFSGLKIAGQEVLPGDHSLLSESLNSISKLKLSHGENTVSISFAALDMTYPENIQYAYMLEGFDKEWNYVGKQRVATYTNLPKGDYVFRVQSTNGAGVWVDNFRNLRLRVEPSFWETPVAYALYVLLFLIVLAGGAYILFVIYRLKHEVSVEQRVTDLKLRFFTNISHELRTPLTLIAGPLEHIMQHSQLSDDVREQLQVVERNTDRMLRLVNQILDFRKIQNNKMKLRLEQIDIVPFVQKVMSNFDTIAEEHKMDFIFESEQPSLMLWVDADKVEKIVFNLLSNAFKYTQEGKSITVFIRENENSVAIGVQDQGIGISKGKQASLFVRFENLLDKNLFTANSTGIGLSLVKELVDLHHATIQVDSKEGEGSCFCVDFLKGKEHYGEEAEFIVSDDVKMEVTETETSVQTATDAGEVQETAEGTKAEAVQDGSKKVMLLVEDNMELRSFLRSIFAARFRIMEASDGQEGLEKALKFVPDIIICDVMMPRKDGISLIRELRGNLNTSHIPIVLLTAKTDMETKLKGMELGVDSYITKPFSATYLEARVENLLVRRQSLREFYCEHLMDVRPAETAPKETNDSMSPQDRKFMERLTELMEKNMDNGELVVDDLVRELAVSRSVFFKKLKSLTGLAPIEFIKEMRVKRAAQLIETGNYNMTQIAYMVGINDPRYFSKCFKHRFGMTPTEYKERFRR